MQNICAVVVMIVCFGSGSGLCWSAEHQIDVPSADDLEAKALEKRKEIRNGEYRLAITTRSQDGKAERVTTSGAHVYFDLDTEGVIRLDWEQPSPRVSKKGEPLTIVSNEGRHVSRIVVSDKRIIYYSPDQLSDGSIVAATVDESQAEGKDAARRRVFDPRVIGFYAGPFFFAPNKTVDSLVGRHDVERRGQIVSEESIAGQRVWRISYQFGDAVREQRARLWIAPDQGYSLLRAEVEHPHGEQTLVEAMECEVEQVGGSDIWFPSTIRGRRILDGVDVVQDEVSLVDVALNRGVDPSVFTFAKMGLRAGTHVHDRTSKPDELLEWDGTRLQAIPTGEPLADIASQVHPRQSRLWLLVGVNAALLAVLFLSLARRRFGHSKK